MLLLNVGCRASGRRAPALAAPSPLRIDETLVVDGHERSYTLQLPPNYDSAPAVPLIIALHGGGGSAAQFEASSLLTPKAEAAGFAVVYPNGSTPGSLGLHTWNGGGCCAYAVEANIDDVTFIRRLIEQVSARYKIDPRRVYATGHSNGAIMSYRLACELSDHIAAIAPNAGPLMLDSCQPTRPVAVMHMHSKLDANVPVQGGIGIGLAGVPFPAVDDGLQRWVEVNGCAVTPQTTTVASAYTLTRWAGCNAGSAIDFYVTDDGGHAWPGGLPGSVRGDDPSTAINANDLLLAFFSAHSLPEPRRVWLPIMRNSVTAPG
jgi:polyhydroxybutyrate depolymerase